MNPKGIRAYVMAVAIAAVGALALVDWGPLWELSGRDQVGLLLLVLLGLVSETMSLRTASKSGSGTFTITFIPLLTSVLLFGPVIAAAFMVIAGSLGQFVVHRRPLLKAVFNVSQYLIATVAAGLAYTWVGGLAMVPDGGTTALLSSLLPFAAYGIVFLLVNHAAVSGAIAISHDIRFEAVWGEVFGKWGSNIVYDLMVSPIAIAVAILYYELWIFGLLTSLLPLFFIRHSYFLNYKLIRANQDLLRALVKAIETRDPYTSGHSVRVSHLAAAIAREMNLNARTVDRIEQSALLHDIGKIDAIYTEILRKPSSLSLEERQVIESHVTKGVDLLESLSSVPASVIADVRHHHERIDGRGYPDRLRGEEIPLGARVINVCDAIDAMLSDRPYRKALTPSETQEELKKFAGIQFDEMVVEIVVNSTILEDHVESVRALHPSPSSAVVGEESAVHSQAEPEFQPGLSPSPPGRTPVVR